MKDTIILLLSQHRQPSNSALPLALTVSQITSLLNYSIAPNQNIDNETIRHDLNELEAMGEILAGDRNQYCIAPPTLLALDEDNLTSLLFTGDRTYLALAHKILESNPKDSKNWLVRPKVHRLAWIKSRLEQVGVRLWTVADSLSNLPIPQKPSKVILRSPLPYNPFTEINCTGNKSIQQYLPKPSSTQQRERWHTLGYAQLLQQTVNPTSISSPLFQIPTGEYLWFIDQEFYELEPDIALLAMFALDAEAKAKLKVIWDEPQGRLNLQGISLPSDYARWLWRISEPVDGMYRTRYFELNKRPQMKEIFKKLGCELV